MLIFLLAVMMCSIGQKPRVNVFTAVCRISKGTVEIDIFWLYPETCIDLADPGGFACGKYIAYKLFADVSSENSISALVPSLEQTRRYILQLNWSFHIYHDGIF